MVNLEAITKKLEGTTCPEHNQHPKLVVAPEGINITACCKTFQTTLNAMLEAEITAELSIAFEQAMGTERPTEG